MIDILAIRERAAKCAAEMHQAYWTPAEWDRWRLLAELDRLFAENARLEKIVQSARDLARAYSARHGIHSAAILTVHDDDIASAVVAYLAPRIEGRTVVEIGGGIGLLSLCMGAYAKRVYCIEANPLWSWTFAALLLAKKPKNVSFLFGAADEFAGSIRGDVALFCTHSDAAGMRDIAGKFAREVIDVYGEIVEPHWNELRDLQRDYCEAP